MDETTIIISTSALTIFIMGLIGFLLKNWFIRKIQYAVKFEYDLKIEELKHDNAKRSRAVLVADLLSEWLSLPEEQKMLNKLTFEAFLWLPQPIASKLSLLFTIKPDSPDIREIIYDVRKYLLQNEDKLNAEEIIIFNQEFIRKMNKNVAK